MKAWFARIRIAVAIKTRSQNSGPLPPEQEMAALDRALREGAPRLAAPVSLHRSIMQAVRAAERPAPTRRGSSFLRWLPAPAVAALALCVVWYVQHAPTRHLAPDPPSLAAAATALEIGGQMAQTAPSVVVAPLTAELESLHRDLSNTAQFLLASLP